MIGKYVLVRCRDAGVHAGYLKEYEGRSCVLTEARRLDRFYCAKGDSLSAVAVYGIFEEDGTRIHVALSEILLTENCEIIPCTEQAADSIKNASEYMP